MIPDFEAHVLPPFTAGDVVGSSAPRSPYIATMSELVARFATTVERALILRGLIAFRDALRGIGYVEGFQWIDGSFVEDCEVVQRRAPADVDVVSVLQRPAAHQGSAEWQDFLTVYSTTLLDQGYCKATYSCDAYFIDLDIPSRFVSEQSAYWSGLFSHQRETFRWKGMVQIELNSDDEQAIKALDEIEATWTLATVDDANVIGSMAELTEVAW